MIAVIWKKNDKLNALINKPINKQNNNNKIPKITLFFKLNPSFRKYQNFKKKLIIYLNTFTMVI